MSKKRCSTPEVQKCLNCSKPDCDCLYRVKPHISELQALLCAGMISPQSIAQHYINKGKRFRKKEKTGCKAQ